MTTTLYLAPAASGKTAYLVELARKQAQDPADAPRVIVPTRLQARAWRARLARAGGALGVEIGTFDDIYRDILRQAGIVVTRLADPVQVRLLRTLTDTIPLTHYAAIRKKPGFIQAVRDMIAELKAGGIFPDALIAAISKMGAPPRLMELAQLYEAYQFRLQHKNWADYAGIGWLAAEALQRQPQIAANWPCVMADGFDDLTTVQTQVLTELALRLRHLIVTLTGRPEGADRPLVHKRFLRMRSRLEAVLGVDGKPLPEIDVGTATAAPIRYLEESLYTDRRTKLPAAADVSMVAVPSREAEVRTALRWLKACIVRRDMQPGDVALLARDLTPYRDAITQVAEEYGLPLQLIMGYPLRSNPAIAALLELLQLAAPGDGYLAWRPTVAAWRSPYFDWHSIVSMPPGVNAAVKIPAQEANTLAQVARWGSVLGGYDQWEETFDLLGADHPLETSYDEEAPRAPDGVPVGEDAEALHAIFARFCERITPPEGACTYRDFVAWLEDLIGDVEKPKADEPITSLGLARRAEEGPAHLAERDLAALNALKDVLRGLVWAESAVDGLPVTYTTFLDELLGAVDAATYRVPLPGSSESLVAAEVTQARGVTYRAVAILGLAEGEFPATLGEDPFLPQADRIQLSETFGLPIDGSPDSLEAQYFYEAITRPRDALLLTRPRIADNGTPWQASPFWEEVLQRLDITPIFTTQTHSPDLTTAASWPETLSTAASRRDDTAAWHWIEHHKPDLGNQITRGAQILAQRTGEDTGRFDGDLTRWHPTFTARFAPQRTWSSSRLEAYRRCPFFFFVSHVLRLEPRQPPSEGLDARQLGNLYHRILEKLYLTVGQGAALEALLAALSDVANPILDSAPRVEQFRATAWWDQTRHRILDNVQQSVEAIESLGDGFTFYEAERTFGIDHKPGCVLTINDDNGDSFRVRGLIDRVDRDAAGRVRIVDYKTGGPHSYTDAAVRNGEKLQLPLYALAAQDALDLGEIAEGFYWHVQHAEASRFKLSRFRGERDSGPKAAMTTAVAMAWEAVRSARSGLFIPVTPDRGCPNYCPAAAFCWHYEASGW